MLGNFGDRIFKLIRHSDYRPVQAEKMAKALGVSEENYEQFKKELEHLRQQGHVVIGARSLISLPDMASSVRGTFRANRKGFGFVIPLTPSNGDLFIPAKATEGAMTGDIVIAKVVRRSKRGGQMRYSGKIVWLEIPVYPLDDDQGMGGQPKVDRENPEPDLRDRSIVGLHLLEDFGYTGKSQWKGGSIYDPANGKTYKCNIKLQEDGTLKVRGYIGVPLLGRTAIWRRPEDATR